MIKLSTAQGVIQHTPNSVTTTTIASLSQGTSARPAEGTGLKEEHCGTFLLVVVAERIKRFLPRNLMISIFISNQVPTHKTLDHHRHHQQHHQP